MSRGFPVAADIGFSSLSALLGTAGQANYAAANMMLNAHAEDRQSQGPISVLPATTHLYLTPKYCPALQTVPTNSALAEIQH